MSSPNSTEPRPAPTPLFLTQACFLNILFGEVDWAFSEPWQRDRVWASTVSMETWSITWALTHPRDQKGSGGRESQCLPKA